MKSSSAFTTEGVTNAAYHSHHSTSSSSSAVAHEWEDLRRQARALENEIDMKLVTFSKLGATYSNSLLSNGGGLATSSHTNGSVAGDGSSQTTPQRYQAMAADLEALMERLTQVNDGLSQSLHASTSKSLPGTAGSGLLHILQRHHDILHDYKQEFLRTKANIVAAREREDLIGSVREDISAYKSASGLNPRTSLLLQEHEHARQSERLLDEHISFAETIKENLRSQHMQLRNVKNRVALVLAKFPMINNLVQKINVRRRRDTIILASVVALCLIFLLWFLLH